MVGRHVLKDPTAADDDQSSVGTREECEGGKGHKGRSRRPFHPPMPEPNNFTNVAGMELNTKLVFDCEQALDQL